MKFFTPDLYQRCRSSDESILDNACREWEQANERYEQYLQSLEPLLPEPLRKFTGLLLHDARVQTIARQDDQLVLVLHKDIPPRDLVILRYQLEGEPTLEPFLAAPGDWSQPTDFQFDELTAVPQAGGWLLTQSIVFGNGWVLHLGFRAVETLLARPVFPVGSPGAVPSLTWPQSA